MMKKIFKRGIVLLIAAAMIALGVNAFVAGSAASRIIGEEEAAELTGADCIIVLGAGVSGGEPTAVLEERLTKCLDLYRAGVSGKIIMSGDHGREDYDEVNVMKDYAVRNGIPSEDVFMDHAGFSTYDSIYRAKEIFKAEKIVIVSQKYHLFRALYIAERLGLEAYGVSADRPQRGVSAAREAREVLARNKDFIKCLFLPEPVYLGEAIPVSGNGDITNDRQ